MGAILGTDAGGHAALGLDAHGERRTERRAAATGRRHHGELELPDLLLAERQADEPATMDGHEIDGLGSHVIGGDAQVAFVLAVLVVDQDDHLARAKVLDRCRNISKRTGGHILVAVLAGLVSQLLLGAAKQISQSPVNETNHRDNDDQKYRNDASRDERMLRGEPDEKHG